MAECRIVPTALGDVEIAVVEGRRPAVLFFPGGHCPAGVDCGWDLYARLSHTIISFSRPGYGRTRVGDLSAAHFVDAVDEVAAAVAPDGVAAAVGTSFGGLQAVHVAVSSSLSIPRLVLHSAAPSTVPFPNAPAERLAGPIVFGPGLQRVTWAMVSRLVGTDRGLRLMCQSLSRRPVREWWGSWSRSDRERARQMFRSMDSGRGFVNDLRQATPATSSDRRRVLAQVPCPTLVTASRDDGGVDFAHAEDLTRTIADAHLVELHSPSHLFWLGPQAEEAHLAVQEALAD